MAIDTIPTQNELNDVPRLVPTSKRHQSQLHRAFQIEEEVKCRCPRVLIVDDEPFNIIALKGQLEMFGIIGSDKAFNGKEALEKV
jgi:PleD family two-component response regulator